MDEDPPVDHDSPTHDLMRALFLAVDRDFRVLNSPEALILLICGSVRHEPLLVRPDDLVFEAVRLLEQPLAELAPASLVSGR